jgi:hypothetical protein
MKLPEYQNREYHLLALAVVFFLVGLFFFWYDRTAPAPVAVPASDHVHPSVFVQPAQSGLPPNSPFANLPPPSGFRTFIYDGTGFNGSSSLAVSATCRDAYVATLIFPAAVDYRMDMASAIYNEAIPCTVGKPFSLTIHPADLGHAASGTYYYFTADEGTTGTWYNPK